MFFFSSRRRHTRLQGDWSSDVCSSDLDDVGVPPGCLLEDWAEALAGPAPLGPEVDQNDSIAGDRLLEIGRASCRERVEISVGGESEKEKRISETESDTSRTAEREGSKD